MAKTNPNKYWIAKKFLFFYILKQGWTFWPGLQLHQKNLLQPMELFFFLKNTGELCFSALRRKGAKTITNSHQHTHKKKHKTVQFSLQKAHAFLLIIAFTYLFLSWTFGGYWISSLTSSSIVYLSGIAQCKVMSEIFWEQWGHYPWL